MELLAHSGSWRFDELNTAGVDHPFQTNPLPTLRLFLTWSKLVHIRREYSSDLIFFAKKFKLILTSRRLLTLLVLPFIYSFSLVVWIPKFKKIKHAGNNSSWNWFAVFAVHGCIPSSCELQSSGAISGTVVCGGTDWGFSMQNCIRDAGKLSSHSVRTFSIWNEEGIYVIAMPRWEQLRNLVVKTPHRPHPPRTHQHTLISL